MSERSPSPSSPPADPSWATETDVHHAYRLLLRREPDDAGLVHHRRLVEEGLPIGALIRAFTDSDEYRHVIACDQRDDQAIVDLGAYRVVVQRSDPDFGADIAYWKVYEEPVRQVLRDRLAPGDVCLDIGANVGVMTFLASTLVGPSGRVIAVEPNPDNVQLLCRGILVNECTNVEVLPLAASDRRAVFGLSGRSNTELVDPGRPAEPGRLAQSVVLDDAFPDIARLDMVKLDIEGHEPAALRGMQRLMTTHRPTLLVEFNPRCLERGQEDAQAFLDQILRLYPGVRAISHFGDDAPFTRSDDLMAFWRRRASEVTAEGKLNEGLLHFDLVTETD